MKKIGIKEKRAIIKLRGLGHTLKEIGDHLKVSGEAVKYHLNVFKKQCKELHYSKVFSDYFGNVFMTVNGNTASWSTKIVNEEDK
ncbi:MAG: hypothetical protein CMB80_24615 [Flammeovirgaceae bacterium]|nr:hypothetical protein [Flammeovirgaceae bacterium]|tara:strand:- start:239 stop:493 length:255 start_codon:yes stop_codon:yes gene_type:complete